MTEENNNKPMMKGSRRNLLIIVCVAIFIVGGSLWSWYKNYSDLKGNMNLIIPGSLDMARTKNMEPVDIHLLDDRTGEGIHLRIPKAYMTKKRNWKGGEQTESLEIETRLSELLPAKALFRSGADEGTPEFEAGLKKTQNGMFIIRPRTRIAAAEDRTYRNYKRKYLIQDEEMFGLEHFYEQACKTETDNTGKETERCWDLNHEYFVAKHGDKKSWVFFDCNRPDMNPGSGCSVNRRYKVNSVQYIFRRSQLHRWQEFDAAVTKLLDQFYVGEVKTKRVSV